MATRSGSQHDLPVRRGSNITYAGRHGEVHLPKPAAARTVELQMWITGADPDTGLINGDPRLRFNDSWDAIRRLVWRPDGDQVALTRRWRLTVAGTPTVLVGTALAEVDDPMSPTMTSPARAEFRLHFLLAEPFFYAATVTSADIPVAGTLTLTNPGSEAADQSHLFLDLVGPLTNPRLTNTAGGRTVWVQLAETVDAGQTVRLDVGAYQARRIADASNRIGALSAFGDRRWMRLRPGANPLTLTADAGTGHAVVSYRPPYV